MNGKVQFILFIYSFFQKSSRKFEASARKNMNTRRIQSEMDGWMGSPNKFRKKRKRKKKFEDWPSVISVITGMIDFQSKKTTDMITRKTN